jgi:hypothetical protein
MISCGSMRVPGLASLGCSGAAVIDPPARRMIGKPPRSFNQDR